MNQALVPFSLAFSTRSLTTSKCGLPKKTECLLLQELEWIISMGTLISSFNGPLFLPLEEG